MTEKQAKLLNAIRNSKNPGKALTLAIMMAQEFIRRHSTENQTEENEIPLYDETDTDGIINEALNKQ